MSHSIRALACLLCLASGAAAQDWDQVAKLRSADVPPSRELFGYSVSVSGSTAIVGARHDADHGADSGSAYVYERVGFRWKQAAELAASDAGPEAYFGGSVSSSGDVVLVGALGAGAGGAAYVFEQIGGVWTEVAKLTASDGAPGDRFGISVCLSGDIAIVGADRDDSPRTDAGSAYVFEKVGGVWTEVAKLTASDADGHDSFGSSVSVSGGVVVAGAPYHPWPGNGAVYVFEKIGGVWAEVAELAPPDGPDLDRYGSSVALSGDTALVGAFGSSDFGMSSGAAYVYERIGGVWTEVAKLTASDGASDDRFGASIALRGDMAVVGAYHDDGRGNGTGSTYVYERLGGEWTETAKLRASDGEVGDYFGAAVALSGDTAVVGAWLDENEGIVTGSAYVFRPLEPDLALQHGLPREGSIVAWGDNTFGQRDVPEPNEGFVAMGAGFAHSLALRADGSIVAWGLNHEGQCDVPEPNEGFVAVAAGFGHSLALKEDGSIVAWGLNDSGQCDVPEPNEGFVSLASGMYHGVGLKVDGSVVAWGSCDASYGAGCEPPGLNQGFVDIAGADGGYGEYLSLALRSDGSVAAWGTCFYGECRVPDPNELFAAVAAGPAHSLGLKADGSVVVWGNCDWDQCDLPEPNEDFVGIAACGLYLDYYEDYGYDGYSLGLKRDGSIVAWGDNRFGQCEVPRPNLRFIAVAAGRAHGLALFGTACPADFNRDGRVDSLDVLVFLNAWAAGGALADCDGDSHVDSRDVVCFLNVWARGC